jgi:hypothetical protein
MAETMGLLHPITLNTRSRASRIARRRNSGSSMIVSIMSKLPPELNPFPAPRRRATLVSGSRSTASQTSASWRCIAGLTELRPGESRVMRSTPAAGRSKVSSSKSA